MTGLLFPFEEADGRGCRSVTSSCMSILPTFHFKPRYLLKDGLMKAEGHIGPHLLSNLEASTLKSFQELRSTLAFECEPDRCVFIPFTSKYAITTALTIIVQNEAV